MKPATAFAACLLALANIAFAQEVPGGPHLTLTGEGEAVSAPDLATVVVAVTSEGATARQALEANNKAVAKTLEALRSSGSAPRDIQTSALSLQLRYGNVRGTDSAGITGYAVSNEVTFRTRDLNGLGALIDRLIASGANEIRDMSFGVSERERLLGEVRRTAFLDAHRKAEIYAEVAGVRLGPVLVLIEEDGPPPRPGRRRLVESAAAAVPLEAGEVAMQARVRVTWRLESRTPN